MAAEEIRRRGTKASIAGGNFGSVSECGVGRRFRYARRIHWSRTLVRGFPQTLDDLVYVSRHHAAKELWLVLLDASASTARHGALAKAKGVMSSLLSMAYRERISVAFLEASGNGVKWRAKAQRPPKAAEQWFDDIGAGGGTPLQDALSEANAWLARRYHRYPQEIRRLFLLTDGRVHTLPNVQFTHTQVLLIDIESGPLRLEKSRVLAHMLDANYVHVDQLPEYWSNHDSLEGERYVI